MSLNLLAEVKSGKPLSADAKAELKKIMSKNLVKSASMGNVYELSTLFDEYFLWRLSIVT